MSESADTSAAGPAPDTVPASAGEPATVAGPPLSAPAVDPASGAAPASAAGPTPAWTPAADDGGLPAAVAERPEIAAGAAFAGGLVLAMILKRLAR